MERDTGSNCDRYTSDGESFPPIVNKVIRVCAALASDKRLQVLSIRRIQYAKNQLDRVVANADLYLRQASTNAQSQDAIA